MNGNEKTDCDREKKLLADLDAGDEATRAALYAAATRENGKVAA